VLALASRRTAENGWEQVLLLVNGEWCCGRSVVARHEDGQRLSAMSGALLLTVRV